MEKILITGASGFVGSHLVDQALSQGLDVYAAIRKSSNRRYLKDSRLNFFPFDFSQPTELVNDLKKIANDWGGFDYIIHNAGVTRPKRIEEFYEGNAEFAEHFAKTANDTQKNLKKFLYISSLAALGPSLDKVDPIITENKTPRPITPYGQSKKAGEDLLKTIKNLNYLFIRPTGVYGPRDKNFIKLLNATLKGWSLQIGEDDQRLSFVYVKDLAKACVDLCLSDIVNDDFNISDGKYYSPLDFASELQRTTVKKTRRIKIPRPLLFSISYVLWGIAKIRGNNFHLSPYKMKELTAHSWACDISKLEKAINYNPQYFLDRGIDEYYNWYKENV